MTYILNETARHTHIWLRLFGEILSNASGCTHKRRPCTTILTSEVLCITGRERERLYSKVPLYYPVFHQSCSMKCCIILAICLQRSWNHWSQTNIYISTIFACFTLTLPLCKDLNNYNEQHHYLIKLYFIIEHNIFMITPVVGQQSYWYHRKYATARYSDKIRLNYIRLD